MAVTKDKQMVLQGTRDTMRGLWRVPLQSLYRPTHHSNNLYQVNGKENSIKYLHISAFRPVQDTCTRAANRGYFKTLTILTVKDINKMTKDESTIKGHLAQSRKNHRSKTTNKRSGEDQAHTDSI